jgi:hypothetical protein
VIKNFIGVIGADLTPSPSPTRRGESELWRSSPLRSPRLSPRRGGWPTGRERFAPAMIQSTHETPSRPGLSPPISSPSAINGRSTRAETMNDRLALAGEQGRCATLTGVYALCRRYSGLSRPRGRPLKHHQGRGSPCCSASQRRTASAASTVSGGAGITASGSGWT